MKRRKFIKNSILTSSALVVGAGFYTWQIEPYWLEIVQKKMSFKKLPDHLIGKTIMQISDIHVGNRFNFHFIIDSFIKAQKLNPDFVVYTGDYVSYESKEQLDQLTQTLKSVVIGKYGTYGILGNHDYGLNWTDQKVADRIYHILKNSGIQVLNNEAAVNHGLNFIGLDDYWGPNFNPQKALSNHKNDMPNIALCHNPDVCDLNVWSGFEGWILSGHTHGGQCKPPFLPPPMLPVKNKKYVAGEIQLDDKRSLYINRALGHLHQVRFNVRPEITIFELEKMS